MQVPEIGHSITMPVPKPESPTGLHDFVQVADADDERKLSRFLGELIRLNRGAGMTTVTLSTPAPRTMPCFPNSKMTSSMTRSYQSETRNRLRRHTGQGLLSAAIAVAEDPPGLLTGVDTSIA